MSAAALAAPITQPLRVLPVGSQEEGFFLIREILERSREMLAAELDHARSIDEAQAMLRQRGPTVSFSSNMKLAMRKRFL